MYSIDEFGDSKLEFLGGLVRVSRALGDTMGDKWLVVVDFPNGRQVVCGWCWSRYEAEQCKEAVIGRIWQYERAALVG